MQDNDKNDQANTQDSDMPQIIGGPSIFADKDELPTDQLQAEGSTATTAMRDDLAEKSSESHISSGDELIEILSGVEQQIERLRGLHLNHEKKLNSIAQRSHAIEDAEISIDSDNNSLNQREEQLEEKANELDALQLNLTDQQTEIEQERQSLKQEQAELAKKQEAADIELENLKEQHVVIDQREESLVEEDHKQQEQRAAMQAILLEKEGQDTAFQDREVEFQQKQIELDQKQQDYTAKQREFEQEREEFNKEQEALQAHRLDNDSKELSFQDREVEFQQKQIAHDQKQQNLTAHLRELEQNIENNSGEIERSDLKQVELEKLCKEYESKQNELQEKLDNETQNNIEFEEQIRLLKDELDDREEKLKDQESQIQDEEQTASTMKQQQDQIEQLKSELAEIRIKADPHLMQRKDERIEELVEALHQARGQIGGEQSIDELEVRVEQLLSKNESLRIQLEQSAIDTGNDNQTSKGLTEAISTTAPADESGPVGEEIQALQTQVQLLHLQADAQDSQIENDELDQIADIQIPSDSNDVEKVDCDVEQDAFRGVDPLAHPGVQAPFENPVIVPPQNHLKRSAGPVKIITTLGWLTVASVIIAGASWLAANHYFPARALASVTFKASSQTNMQLTNDQKQLWQTWHTNLLTSADFTGLLSKRLAARRLDKYADVNALRTYLDKYLAPDLILPGAITLTLEGSDKNVLTTILDTLASTFISESDKTFKDNGEGLETLAVGTRTQGNQVLYSSLNPAPGLDERLKYATYMFVVGFFGAVILVSIISRRPVRPSDIFSESDPVFVTPQH